MCWRVKASFFKKSNIFTIILSWSRSLRQERPNSKVVEPKICAPWWMGSDCQPGLSGNFRNLVLCAWSGRLRNRVEYLARTLRFFEPKQSQRHCCATFGNFGGLHRVYSPNLHSRLQRWTGRTTRHRDWLREDGNVDIQRPTAVSRDWHRKARSLL